MKPRFQDPDPARWELIEAVCFEAMDMDPEARSRFLERRCSGDADLRGRVETLLAALERSPDFMERPAARLPRGGGAPQDVPPSGTRVGPYRIVRPLGHGGMGDVFLATQEGDGFSRPVALKLIRRGLDTERVLDRFRTERRILAGLRHSNIAQLLGGGAAPDGRPYFVMEFVEGEPVDEYCARARVPLRGRVELVELLCAAVHHAHQNLVVHRDIKPQNVLVTREGVPKLLDFGIAKVLAGGDDADDDVTRVDERALTPAYAAPELIAGEAVTTAVDVYGLGVLLYRLLAGVLPYPSQGTRQERIAERSMLPPPPSSVAPPGERVGGELDAIVLKAMAPDREDRYGSAVALAEDLRRFLEGRPVRARPPGLLYLVRKFVRRHRVGVAAAAVVAASLAGSTLYTAAQSRRVAAERDKALEVRGFLLEAFGAAGADRSVGDSVTARALLDGQAMSLREAYSTDLDLQAEMMVVLAEGYERLGLFTEALGWAREAAALRAESPPGERAAAETLVGWITHQIGRPDEALPILHRAVEDARGGGGGRVLARALNDLGVVQEALGDFDGAGESHREAMELRVELFGEEHRSVAVSSSNLSVIRYRQGDLEGAVEEAARALRALRASLGPDHQRAIIVQSNLAVFRLVSGDLEGAEADFRDLWERQARLQGADHPVTVRVMSSLASVLRQQEKWMEAESVLRQVVRIMESWEEASPTDLATALSNLGDAVAARGDFAEGRALLVRALAMQEQVLGTGHVDVADTRRFLARLYERSDSLDQAARWAAAALSSLEVALGEGSRPALDQRLALAGLLRRAGRGEEAGAMLSDLQERVDTYLDPDDPLADEVRRAISGAGEG